MHNTNKKGKGMEYPLKINVTIDFNNGEMVGVYSTNDEVVLESVTVSKSIDGKETEVEFWTHMGNLIA